MRRADQLTVSHLLAFLKARGHAVDLYCINTGAKAEERHLSWLRDHCEEVYLYPLRWWTVFKALLLGLTGRMPFQVGLFSDGQQRKDIVSRASRYDVIYTYYIRSAEVTKGVGRTENQDNVRNRPVTFLAYQLSQSLNAKRIAENAPNIAYKLFYMFESSLIARYESKIWGEFTRTVLIGPKDVETVEECCSKFNLPSINNYVYGAHGTDLNRFKPRAEILSRPNHIVFSGVMRTPTNIQAVHWFAKNVWPLVKRECPDATWDIVGREPSRDILALAEMSGVNVTGTVPDPAENIAEAAVCVNPMQAGGGMQNKLIEYLASEKAVVATNLANEGIAAVDGVHLLIADDPEKFSQAILGLLRDDKIRQKIASNGREFVTKNWTWEAHWLKLESDFFDAIDGRPCSHLIRPSEVLLE
jgi:glycosyltransferase involved in cell wall biosynthesis